MLGSRTTKEGGHRAIRRDAISRWGSPLLSQVAQARVTPGSPAFRRVGSSLSRRVTVHDSLRGYRRCLDWGDLSQSNDVLSGADATARAIAIVRRRRRLS